jgi:hypothetical protein
MFHAYKVKLFCIKVADDVKFCFVGFFQYLMMLDTWQQDAGCGLQAGEMRHM